jgi:hypothetical protein
MRRKAIAERIKSDWAQLVEEEPEVFYEFVFDQALERELAAPRAQPVKLRGDGRLVHLVTGEVMPEPVREQRAP